MSLVGNVSKLAGGFAMVAADNAVADQEGVIASRDVTYGRSFSNEFGLGLAPSPSGM